MGAIVGLREHARLEPKPGLYEAQDLVVRRLQWLTEYGGVNTEPTVTVADLLDRARAIAAPVAAIEAIWDGDTQGWFVELLAIVERAGPRHPRYDEVSLALIRHGGDIRLFNGTVPPWPEAVTATEHGRALSQALSVPFHFASPSTPDDQAPRWWD